jgi:hypothetical protein
MYILVLGAVLLSLCIVAVERRRGSPAGGLIGVITLSFACFALVIGLFWVFFPGLTASLVPGSVRTPLAAGVVQVRGALVVSLAVFIVLTRTRRAAGERVSGLAGPALYNVLMAYESIAAQFTGIATAERWLYVVLHTTWAVGFVLLTIFPRVTAAAGGGSRPARVVAGLYGSYAVLIGIATVVVPTGLVQAFGEEPGPYVTRSARSPPPSAPPGRWPSAGSSTVRLRCSARCSSVWSWPAPRRQYSASSASSVRLPRAVSSSR